MNIKDKLVSLLKKFPEGKRAGDLQKTLKVSRPTLLRYLGELELSGDVVKFSNGPQTWYYYYEHADKAFRKGLAYFHSYPTQNLREEDVYDEVNVKYLKKLKLSDQAITILRYAFQEMLNNAIEHSDSHKVYVEFSSNEKDVQFLIRDWGVGAFRSIQHRLGRNSELEAAQDILKGKTTTDPESHSGEGIFFTSKAADFFVLYSFGYAIKINNKKDDVSIIRPKVLKGTQILFSLNKNTHKHLTDIFRRYTEGEDFGFNTTEIRVKLFTMFSHHVSRSQARRVLVGLEKFSHIILDFESVPNIGQAFADEIFRVFRQKHPGIKISAINMSAEVEFMLNRAQSNIV